jgi:KDO2-lipid IV(A) lauroyltransferase
MKILLAIFKGLSYLPLPLLYILSDVLFVLVYYVVRYRRGVVRRNIDASFPEHTAKERRGIERDSTVSSATILWRPSNS